MKRLTVAFLAVALMATGCLRKGDDADGARKALPSADHIQVKVPGAARMTLDGQTVDGIGQSSAALLGQTAEFYAFTRQVSGTLNLGAGFVLVLVHAIVHFPVTSVEGDTYIWGPWTDALNPAEWRLTVRETAEGDYAWAFEGRRKLDGAGAAYRAVVSGLATPGTPGRGSGSFMMDFDVAEELDPVGNDAQGQLSVSYDLESDPAAVEMDYETLAAMPDGTTAQATFHYEYAERREGSGDFQFSIYADLDENNSAWEHADIRSRWTPQGAGRADLRLSGGDEGAMVSVTGSQCWAAASFAETYWTDSASWRPTEGDPASCPYADPMLPGQ